MSKKIGFGILCNSFDFEQWEANCIRSLIQHPHIELKLIVLNKEGTNYNNSFIQKLIKYPYKHFLYRAFKRFSLKATSYKIISLKKQLSSVPVIECNTIKKGRYSEYFSHNDIIKIKSFETDFLLRFGFNIIKGDILQCSKFGVWSFHHADNDFIRGGPIGFWEIFLKRTTCAAVLQQLNNHLDQGKILRKGYLKTIDHSFAQQIDQLTEVASSWPLQVCIDIINGEDIFQYSTQKIGEGKLYKYPNNLQFVYFIFCLTLNKLRFHYRQLFRAESWQVARVDKPLDDFIVSKENTISYLSKPSHESYAADPFFVSHSNQSLMLFEYYTYKQQKGKIAISNTNGEGMKFIDFGDELHRSYPFCFAHEGSTYCLPEQAAAGKVTLYTINKEGIVLQSNDLIKGFSARDSSLVYYDNKWWLFCTLAGPFENAALYIFFSNQLKGPFVPHNNNPVKIDVSNARPAGNFFIKNNNLYRPAQNCALHYGHCVNINKIICLNESSYKEEIVAEINAEAIGAFTGIHHISWQENQVLIDLKQSRLSLNELFYQTKRKLKKIF